MDQHRTQTSRQRIIAAARTEIESKGILGLRVQDVAAQGKVSVPLIYKYFTDRDGLLAEVLGEMFEEFVMEQIDSSEAYFFALSNPTVDDLIAVLTLPQQDFRRPRRWFRVQILAASMEIPSLRARLRVVQMAIQDRLTALLEDVQVRITGGHRPVSSAALALLIQTYAHGFVLNDLLEEDGVGVTNEEFASLMRVMLQAAIFDAKVPSLD
jgi:AcrR family transcriptional regulator